jgi:hypothetical protein
MKMRSCVNYKIKKKTNQEYRIYTTIKAGEGVKAVNLMEFPPSRMH